MDSGPLPGQRSGATLSSVGSVPPTRTEPPKKPSSPRTCPTYSLMRDSPAPSSSPLPCLLLCYYRGRTSFLLHKHWAVVSIAEVTGQNERAVAHRVLASHIPAVR